MVSPNIMLAPTGERSCPLGFLFYVFPIFLYVIHVFIGMGSSSALIQYLNNLVEDHAVMLQTKYHYIDCVFRPECVFFYISFYKTWDPGLCFLFIKGRSQRSGIDTIKYHI